MSGWFDPFDFGHTLSMAFKGVFGVFRLSSYFAKEIEKATFFLLRVCWWLIRSIARLIMGYANNEQLIHINKRFWFKSWQKSWFLSSFQRNLPLGARKKHTYIRHLSKINSVMARIGSLQGQR
jgi:hypothetical protein